MYDSFTTNVWMAELNLWMRHILCIIVRSFFLSFFLSCFLSFVGQTNRTNTYVRFHWNCYTPNVHQIQKLKCMNGRVKHVLWMRHILCIIFRSIFFACFFSLGKRIAPIHMLNSTEIATPLKATKPRKSNVWMAESNMCCECVIYFVCLNLCCDCVICFVSTFVLSFWLAFFCFNFRSFFFACFLCLGKRIAQIHMLDSTEIATPPKSRNSNGRVKHVLWMRHILCFIDPSFFLSCFLSFFGETDCTNTYVGFHWNCHTPKMHHISNSSVDFGFG